MLAHDLECGRSKIEFEKPGTIGFVSMGGIRMIAGNGAIVEEMIEIHDLPQRIPVVSPSLGVLQGHLRTTCSSARVGGPLCMLIDPF